MSYHEGSNWQAKKEDAGKPLYEKAYTDKEFTEVWNALNTLQGKFHNVKIVLPKQYEESFRKAIEARYGTIVGSKTYLSNCELIFI
jgi:hypothetical protein